MTTTIQTNFTTTDSGVYAENHSITFDIDFLPTIQRWVVRTQKNTDTLPAFFARTYYLSALDAAHAIKYWDRKY